MWKQTLSKIIRKNIINNSYWIKCDYGSIFIKMEVKQKNLVIMYWTIAVQKRQYNFVLINYQFFKKFTEISITLL